VWESRLSPLWGNCMIIAPQKLRKPLLYGLNFDQPSWESWRISTDCRMLGTHLIQLISSQWKVKQICTPRGSSNKPWSKKHENSYSSAKVDDKAGIGGYATDDSGDRCGTTLYVAESSRITCRKPQRCLAIFTMSLEFGHGIVPRFEQIIFGPPRKRSFWKTFEE